MDKKPSSRLIRPRYEMPEIVRKALLEKGVMDAYRARPPYQRNDYIGWILRAKLKPTQEKRLAQMLDELARGDRYMKMIYQTKRVHKEKT
jgi:hypothetical protein